MSKKNIIILGAGLCGLSVAWHLKKMGIAACVYEKEDKVGGLCKSESIGDFEFDYDGHVLHFRYPYVFNLVQRLLNNNILEFKRSSWFYFHGKYFPYPFQANLYGFPFRISRECLLGFIEAQKNKKTADNKNTSFLDWINHTFGPGIAKYFMIPYNDKFWTVAPKRLTYHWSKRVIPVPSLSQIIEGTLSQSKNDFGYNIQFWYPRSGGIMQLPLAFAKGNKNIFTGVSAVQIDLKKKIVYLSNGEKNKFDYLISTIPLPELGGIIKDMPYSIKRSLNRLRWNSIFNLNLGFDDKRKVNRHWIYFPQKNISFFRVGFYSSFSAGSCPKEKKAIYTEVSYSRLRPLRRKGIKDRIKRDLIKTGIIASKNDIVVEFENDIKYGYPIYDKNYAPARLAILDYLKQNKMFSCGRYGSWAYMSMEDVILDGYRIANSIKG